MKIKTKILFLIFFTFLLFYFLTFLYSAPHISGKKGEPKVRPKVLPDVSYLRIKGAPRKEIAKTLGTIGTKKVAVIIVDFPDQKFSSEWATQANQTFSQLKNYYDEVSYGQLQLDITFFYQGGSTKTLTGTETAYTMSKNMSYYAQNTEESLSQLVKDAISASSVSSANYDCVIVLHAGYGEESNPPVSSIWSVYVNWEGQGLAVNGFTDGTIVPEKEYNASPLGIVCHEFGHQLGLPDLYYPAPDGNQYSIVGYWCLMDAGCWLGNPLASQPAHLSAWCKDFLGWVDLQIVSPTIKNIQLPYVEASSSVIKVEILTADDPQKEYFLLEYRRKTLFDSSLPGEGLLIWYIDDNIARNPDRLKVNDINSGVPHLGVDLIEADKTVISNNNPGDSGDPFPGSGKVTSFIPEDFNIKTHYNSQPINITLINIATGSIYCNFDIVITTGLYVTVKTLDGLPLPKVKILLTQTNISTETYTNNFGSAFIELSSTGVWRMECSLVNYSTYTENIEIFPERLTVKNVILRYNPQLLVKKNSLVIGNNYFDYNTSKHMLFRYNIEEPCDIEIVVYNLSGKPIKTFKRYHDLAGYYEEFWDVKDDFNNRLQPGLYFVSYKTKFGTKVEKFIIKK